MITSGAASSVYPGWSGYSAGKAAVDQWVRTAGAEQAERDGRCRVLSVAPGTVDTDMQARIRATDPRDFPRAGRFAELHETGGLVAPHDAARGIWALLDDDLDNGTVTDLRSR
jgi:benzil reductase ((S)-benzoin forming)